MTCELKLRWEGVSVLSQLILSLQTQTPHGWRWSGHWENCFSLQTDPFTVCIHHTITDWNQTTKYRRISIHSFRFVSVHSVCSKKYTLRNLTSTLSWFQPPLLHRKNQIHEILIYENNVLLIESNRWMWNNHNGIYSNYFSPCIVVWWRWERFITMSTYSQLSTSISATNHHHTPTTLLFHPSIRIRVHLVGYSLSKLVVCSFNYLCCPHWNQIYREMRFNSSPVIVERFVIPWYY